MGDAKGLLSAAMRTSCRLVPPVLTALTAASQGSGVAADLGIRLVPDLGVRLGVVTCRLGVRVADAVHLLSSPSTLWPGVLTRNSSREVLIFCIFWNIPLKLP